MAAPLLAVAGAVAHGQTSPLYMISYDTNEAVVVQNGQVTTAWTNTNTETAMAIDSTVRVLGRNPGLTGAEYDLGGNLLNSGVYPNPLYVDVYDGTTDGTYNYGIAHNDFDTNFAVIRGDADWGNLEVLFVPTIRSSGIAYDSSTDTLWITNNSGGYTGLQQYDLNGNLLFETLGDIGGAGYGLAYDPADDTLWMTGAFNSGVVDAYQLDKSGNILAQIDLPDYATNWISAEMQIPAPGSLALLGLGGLLARRRR
jgi:uncharacterized protein (TIGR03382 family)